MSKSSIHFREAMPTSEAHNMRQVQLDYNEPSLEVNNESVVYDSIADRLKQVQAHCKKVSGRKLQKNAQVIREAVVNLKPGTTMDDLKELAQELKQEYGINCFQIHIHRDEGHKDPTTGEFKINHHAHMVFDWQDRKKGTVQKLNRMQMSQMQTLVAKVLDMERGELKENSNRERLEPIEFKRVQEEKRYKELQQQNADLEQKMKSEQELKSLNEKEAHLMTIEVKKKPSESVSWISKVFTSNSQKKILQTRFQSLKTKLNELKEKFATLQNQNSLKKQAEDFLQAKRNELEQYRQSRKANSPVQTNINPSQNKGRKL